MKQGVLGFTETLPRSAKGRPVTNGYGLCEICKFNPKTRSGKKYKGKRYFKRWCESCRPDKDRGRRKVESHRRHMQMTCQRCGFEAMVKDQIDVHHKNGNHKDNSIENLESLCANCHRLEHAMQRSGR